MLTGEGVQRQIEALQIIDISIICSGQQILDTVLSLFSAASGLIPPLN